MSYETDLSVTPAMRQMGSNDTESFAFDAGEAITAATAEIVNYQSRKAAGTVSVTTAGNVADVKVSGLTFGNVYQVVVTFTNASGISWSRTLVIECVA